ncbi:hypothetical protein ACFQ3K_09800 [Brucella gallinifaecis]|uniref:Uncharacterized protein n=1 Tax=Brucella gallinifaecis TaxID=215590 RepID=A0A502BSN1_9HYPH|nr:hypothetical protein [Brucella gallinifaecis]TPF76857.1 hypothetical protein FHY56_00325 [Brucella gallinifaecis]
MRDVEMHSSAVTVACPEKKPSSGLRAWITRLFRRKRHHYVLSKYSPEYLLHDVGIKDGRPTRYDGGGHKLPEW